MKFSINSLYYDNIDPRLLQSSKMVMQKMDIPVVYTQAIMHHGHFMDAVCKASDADLFIFFDVDCVPTNREFFNKCVDYAISNDTFIGNAQVSNHIPPAHHIYAAPSFFVITRSCYEQLGKPSFAETYRADVAEEVSYLAEARMKRYTAIYPTKYEKASGDGMPWRLGNYGSFGIGTLYGGGIYHLFESRTSQNIDLYVRRCNEIVRGEFDTTGMIDCAALTA